jgi:hypothetical protein
VLPLHEAAADPAATEPLHAGAKAGTDHDSAESATEPLHVAADPAVVDAALTKTSWLCVRI